MSALDDLASGKYLSLTTFRRDGTPVPTPVWLVRDGDALRPWLFSILYRQFLDGKRRSGRMASLLSRLAPEPEPAPSAERETIARSSLDALRHLTVEQRSLLPWVSVVMK